MKRQQLNTVDQRGFILIAVSLALAVLAALTLSSSQFAGNSDVKELVAAEQLEQMAQAALTRSRQQWQRDNCNNYTTFSDENLSDIETGSFSASATPNSGSPVLIDLSVSVDGASRNLQITGETMYQWPHQSASISTATQGFDNSIHDGIQDQLNYGIADTLRLQNQLGRARPLIHFDLSGISANVELKSATLQLNIVSNNNSGDVSATIYRLRRDWLEGSMNGAQDSAGSSWEKYNGGTDWNNEGGDYSSSAYASLTIPAAYTGPLSVDIQSLVNGWIKGYEANQGLIIIADSGTETLQFASGENSDAVSHPNLSLEWRCPCNLGC